MPKQKSAPLSVGAEVQATVLAEVSEERLRLTRQRADHNKLVAKTMGEIEERLQPFSTAVIEANAELARVDRYRGKVAERDYAKMRSPVVKRQKEAEAALREQRRIVEPEVQEANAEGRRIADRLQQLAMEWQVHERVARAAGIDVDAYWVPGKPLPPLEGAAGEKPDEGSGDEEEE